MRGWLLVAAAAGCVGQPDAPGGGVDGGGGGSDAGDVADVDAAVDAAPLPLPEIEIGVYHTQEEIAAYLRAVAEARPGLVRFEVLGESQEGRELAYVVIDGTGDVDPPAVLANGTHHGDEKSATEAPLAVIDALLRRAGEPEVAALLDEYAFFVLPLVSPDGHAHHSRYDVLGRDPNRDYSYPGRSDAESFDLPEIALVKQLSEQVEFHAALAYHSGIEEVIWPWAYTGNATADAGRFAELAEAACTAMGFDRWLQSYDDYPTTGEYIDYAYWKHGTMAVTVEVSAAKNPAEGSTLAGVVERAVDGTLAFMTALRAQDQGGTAAAIAPSHGHLGLHPWVGERRE